MMLSIVWKGSTLARKWLPGKASLLSAAFACLLLACFATITAADNAGRLDEVYQLLGEDRVAEARTLLHAIVSTDYADAERLSLLARLSEDSDSTFARYYRSLELTDRAEEIGPTLLGLSDYAIASSQVQLGLELLERYHGKAGNSKVYPEILINWARMLIATGDPSRIKGDIQDQLGRTSEPQTVARLLLTLGDIELARRAFSSAQEYYRRLANRSDQRFAGVALLRLAESYLQQGDIDNAHFTYNIIAERYPRTTGLEQFRNRVSSGRGSIDNPLGTDQPGDVPASSSHDDYCVVDP